LLLTPRLVAALVVFGTVAATPMASASGGCSRKVSSHRSAAAGGFTLLQGSARMQGRVRLKGCDALRLSPGPAVVGRELSGRSIAGVAFAYRSEHPGARPLLSLQANAITLTDDGRGRVVVYRNNRRVARVPRRARRTGWTQVRVTLTGGQLALWVDGRSAPTGASLAKTERRALFGGRAARRRGALFLDAVAITGRRPDTTPAATGAGTPTGGVPATTSGGSGSSGWSPDPSGTASLRPFAAGSFWNARLADDAPVDPASNALVAELRRQLDLGAPWINTTQYSTPVYRVPAGAPTVRVTLDIAYQPLQQAWENVPVPANARPAGGTDGVMVVWQPSTDTLWEFWLMRQENGAWHARWGGRLTGVSSSPGYYTGAERHWGVSATSLPLLGGLITLDDVRSGHIDHALGVAIPEARRDWWTWPAQRTDGKKDDPGAIPEGARFRLDPSLNLNSLHLYPLVRMMAEAAQRYGIVVRDQAGVVAFAGEDPTPTGTNPWAGAGGWFSGQSPATLVRQFPWQYLQALRTDQQCCGG
jgi:hypothetical protein